jgi:hypothetical protein
VHTETPDNSDTTETPKTSETTEQNDPQPPTNNGGIVFINPDFSGITITFGTK